MSCNNVKIIDTLNVYIQKRSISKYSQQVKKSTSKPNKLINTKQITQNN